METRSCWLVAATFAAGLGAVASVAPAHAQDDTLAQDDGVRVLLDVAGLVVLDRTGDHDDDDRPAVRRDRYGRPIYFRYIPVDRHRPPRSLYGTARDDHRDRARTWSNDTGRNAECDGRDNCETHFRVDRSDDRGRRGDD